jgi:hypothetical protein
LFFSEFEWKRRGFVVGYKERAEKMKERSTKIRYLIKGLNESKGFFFFFFLFCFKRGRERGRDCGKEWNLED